MVSVLSQAWNKENILSPHEELNPCHMNFILGLAHYRVSVAQFFLISHDLCTRCDKTFLGLTGPEGPPLDLHMPGVQQDFQIKKHLQHLHFHGWPLHRFPEGYNFYYELWYINTECNRPSNSWSTYHLSPRSQFEIKILRYFLTPPIT